MKHQLNQLHKLIMPTGKKIGYKLFMFKGPLIFRCTCWCYKRRDAHLSLLAKRGRRPRAVRFINSPRAQRIIMITGQSSLILFDLSLRHFKWTCPQIDYRLLNQNELWKSLRSLLVQRIRGKLVTVYIQISLWTGTPFWVKGPKNREQTEGASFTEVFLLFLTKESASRLPCARTAT